MFDLAQRIGGLKEKTDGEYAGSCPQCGGQDRFLVWPSDGDSGGFWCRQCGFSGDGIDYLQEVQGMSFQEACRAADCEEKLESVTGGGSSCHTSDGGSGERLESVTSGGPESHTCHTSGDGVPPEPESPRPSKRSAPPIDQWQRRAERMMTACRGLLWENQKGASAAWSYLEGRGFDRETIDAAFIGVNPEPQFDDPEDWGLDSDRKVWLPRGIVIPWMHAGHMWGLNIRRPNGDLEPDADENWKGRKYQRAAGSRNALYNADELDGRPVALVEGELDALAIQQETDEVAAVATGSTAWGRTPRWRALLRCAPVVLVAFDAEDAGEQAAKYWTDTLPNAVRWRPHLHDAAEMLEAEANIARWIDEGLDEAVKKV